MTKRILCFLFLICALILTACDSRGSYEDGYSAGYEQALKDAAGMAEDRLKDELNHLSKSIDKEYGFDPEDAVLILGNFADGQPTSERDLTDAIWAIWEYYHSSNDLIDEIGLYIFD